MFGKKKEKSELTKAMETRITNLVITSGDADEDAKAIKNLKDLSEIQERVEGSKINPNTVVTVVGSAVTVFGILFYERLHVLTSKALSFVIRPR